MAWGIMPFTCEFRYIKEVTTAPRQSLLYGFSYMGKNPIADSLAARGRSPYSPVVWIRGFRLQFMYRIYFSKNSKAPIGWYTGPYYSYSTAKYSMRNLQMKGIYLQGTQWHVSWVIGRQKLWGKHLCYDIYTGIGYKENTWEYHALNKIQNIDIGRFIKNKYYQSNFKICVGFNIGYIF